MLECELLLHAAAGPGLSMCVYEQAEAQMSAEGGNTCSNGHLYYTRNTKPLSPKLDNNAPWMLPSNCGKLTLGGNSDATEQPLTLHTLAVVQPRTPYVKMSRGYLE